jgi:hemolysin activation/secretion protein
MYFVTKNASSPLAVMALLSVLMTAVPAQAAPSRPGAGVASGASAKAQHAASSAISRQAAGQVEAQAAPGSQSAPGGGEKTAGEPPPDTSAAAEGEFVAPEEQSEAEAFDIWEFQVEGNTLLPQKDIERSVYPHLGPKKTIDNVEAARKQLEQMYQERGYGTVFVDIPEQDVIGGVVKFKVNEGKVERLRVTGSRYFSLGRIKSKVPSLNKDSVPHLPTVQEELVALNKRSSDRSITPVLRPGKTPGKVEVELKVEDELPLHGSVEINDRYSPDTTRLRLGGTVRYDNLWQKEHGVSASYQTSPEDTEEVQVFAGTYLWKFEDSDNLLALYGVMSDTSVATVGTLGVIGSGVIVGARYIMPLTTLGNYYHNVTLGADYKDFDESVGLLGADTLETPISYVMFGPAYSGTWIQEEATSHLNAAVNFAPRGMGNTQEEFENKRFQAQPNFAYLRLSGDHSEPLGLGAAFFARLSGQIASGPLISNEQFGAGGADTVRGYLESQALGDDGITGTLEVRSPSLGTYFGLKEDKVQNLQLLAFTDAAQLRIRQPLPAQEESTFLWSTGTGMRAALFNHFDAELMWAYPLKESGTVREGESRFHFNFGYEF